MCGGLSEGLESISLAQYFPNSGLAPSQEPHDQFGGYEVIIEAGKKKKSSAINIGLVDFYHIDSFDLIPSQHECSCIPQEIHVDRLCSLL